MTLTELEAVLRRHRFRATTVRPLASVWTRGNRRAGARWVATLTGSRLDVVRSSDRRPITGTLEDIHASTPAELDAWVHHLTHS